MNIHCPLLVSMHNYTSVCWESFIMKVVTSVLLCCRLYRNVCVRVDLLIRDSCMQNNVSKQVQRNSAHRDALCEQSRDSKVKRAWHLSRGRGAEWAWQPGA